MPANDLMRLHGAFREKLTAVLAALASETIPLRVFETYRTPARQAELYAQGRVPGYGTPDRHVTRARAWESFHQYGMAADLVFYAGGRWSWIEPSMGMWARYQQIAVAHDLRPLDFEKPHIEYPARLSELRAGNFPPGGGDTWAEAIYGAIRDWGSGPRIECGITQPPAPLWQGPAPEIIERPPLAA